MHAETLAPAPSANPEFLGPEAAPVPSGQLTFRDAVSAYEAQKAAVAQLVADMHAADAAATAAAPPPSVLLGKKGRIEFLAESTIIDDRKLSVEEKAEALRAFRAWRPKFDAAYEAYAGLGIFEHSELHDSAMDALSDASSAVIEATPTSTEDLLFQVRLTIEADFIEFNDEHVDDPTTLSRLLSSGWGKGRWIALLYRNASVLAGKHTPILDAQVWDAEKWLTEFEATPGHHFDERGVYFADEAFENGRPASVGLWSALRTWQKKAVMETYRRRNDDAAQEWAAKWRASGGTFGLVKNEIYFGGSMDPGQSAIRDELSQKLNLDRKLKDSVRQLVRTMFQ